MPASAKQPDDGGTSVVRQFGVMLVLGCLIPALTGCPVDYFYEFNWEPVIQVTHIDTQEPVASARVYFQEVVPDVIDPAPIDGAEAGLYVPLTADADPSVFPSTTTGNTGQAMLDITKIAFAGPPHTIWAPQAQLPGTAYRIRVDAGADVEVLTLDMLPGASASGEHLAIQVLSIMPAEPIFPPHTQ
jgi:hypothetical protein